MHARRLRHSRSVGRVRILEQLIDHIDRLGDRRHAEHDDREDEHERWPESDDGAQFVQASGPVKSGTVQIAYRNITIQPDAPRVKVGSTIRWTNFDNIAHNVTSEGGPQKFASKDFGENGTFEIKALKPG